MSIDAKLVQKAKEKLGDDNASKIAELLGIQNFDERNLKSCCPFHNEDTPSFIYDSKRYRFHCFGCQKNVDIIDAYMLTGKTYTEAVQELFKLTNTKYSFGMHGVRQFSAEYTYPKDVPDGDIAEVKAYWQSRGISESTLRHCGVREDENTNTVFRYFDTNDVLTLVKYRPSRPVKHGEGNKCWCQKNADTKPLLFNMNRINMDSPLLICEGEGDCMSAIEAGWLNAVSVPFGAGNFAWIDENWDWLDQFASIIICGDNDKPGREMNREVAHRLGLWRTRLCELPQEYTDADGETVAISDINDTLCTYGPETVMNCIVKAKESPVDSVVDIADIDDVDLNALDGLYTGLSSLDSQLGKTLLYGSLTILTGVNGCTDCDTEFLSKSGWKRMDEYEQGDSVLMFNEDGSAQFVQPEEYTRAKYDGDMLEFKAQGVRQCVTPDHTMVFVGDDGQLHRVPAEEVRARHSSEQGFEGRFIQTFGFNAPTAPHNITNLELQIQTLAILRGVRTGGRESAKRRAQVTVVFDHLSSVKRVEKLLAKAGISYSRAKFHTVYRLSFIPPFTYTRFEGMFWRLNKSQQGVVLREAKLHRQCRIQGLKCYESYVKSDMDYIQFLLAARGEAYRLMEAQEYDGKPVYRLIPIAGLDSRRLDECIPVQSIKAPDGFKYCFTVPTGMFVTRRDGIINVTGNSGKSSFISQLMCQCIEQGRDAWIFSGELPNYMTRAWAQYVMAGPHHVTERRDERGMIYYNVPPDVKSQINDYWRGRLFVYKDGLSNKADDLLSAMEISARRYGCKLFIIDNLTCINIGSNEDNRWEMQDVFITKLINFAKKFDVAVVLVIHPRKLQGVVRMSKMDIQGSNNMVNLAHRALSLYRVTPKDREGIPFFNKPGWKVPPVRGDIILDVLKDRFSGQENLSLNLWFDKASRRFFGNQEELNYSYGWDKNPVPKNKWLWPDKCQDDPPF